MSHESPTRRDLMKPLQLLGPHVRILPKPFESDELRALLPEIGAGRRREPGDLL